MDEGSGVLDGNAWRDAFTQVLSSTSDPASDVNLKTRSPFEGAVQDLAHIGFVEEARPDLKATSSAIYVRVVY